LRTRLKPGEVFIVSSIDKSNVDARVNHLIAKGFEYINRWEQHISISKIKYYAKFRAGERLDA
jgi:hypothetical protein